MKVTFIRDEDKAIITKLAKSAGVEASDIIHALVLKFQESIKILKND